MNIREILVKAREIIRTRYIRGYRHSGHGCCALGALEEVMGNTHTHVEGTINGVPVVRALAQGIGPQFKHYDPLDCANAIMQTNDGGGFSDTLRMFDRAIALQSEPVPEVLEAEFPADMDKVIESAVANVAVPVEVSP